MIAAYKAAIDKASVTLLEQNEKLGKKLFITGKGRCNLTNACEPEEFFDSIVSNPKFMYSSYYGFDSRALMELIEKAGCPLKIERGNRVFPVSDHSYDILDALKRLLKDAGVKVVLNTRAIDVTGESVITDKGKFLFDSLVIATGGKSYPATGSTGDGYLFGQKIGHSITEPECALVPFEIEGEECRLMQGLSLKNVSLSLQIDGKDKYSSFGEMLFTHFGVSGPLVLSASSYYTKLRRNPKFEDRKFTISIDLKPALSKEELDKRILKDFDEAPNRDFGNSLDRLLPKSMIPVIVKRSGIDALKKVNLITKEERAALAQLFKNLEFEIKGTRSFLEAIVTDGGIKVNEINPSTMESKIRPGVFWAGEVIDVAGLTGGFNLQIAFSTGYLAGESAANYAKSEEPKEERKWDTI